MRALLFTTIVLAGCTKQNPDFCPANPDDPRCGGTGSDGGMGSDGDSGPTGDARLSFGSGAYAIQLTTGAVGLVSFTGTPINTDATPCITSQVWVDSNQPDACFIVGADITIPSTSIVGVTGTRPLVLVASNTITIAGTLDVASHVGATMGGPGSPDASCMAGMAPTTDGSGGGGGAGGSFMGKGADGGGGNGSNNGGKAANPSVTGPMYLRAGCNAQPGAAGGTGGAAGRGGGAVYLVAGNQITLAGGRINASGAGGGAASGRGGGGGGGSGGMIVLYAPMISSDVDTKLLANGGGGAGGANNGGGSNVGGDPDPANPAVGGIGGIAGGGCGTNTGGNGQASNAVSAGGSGPSNCGGGGGGGGIGFIQTNVALGPGTFSPVPMLSQ